MKATNWWVGRKKRSVGILGCGEPGKNPLPGLDNGRAQGICAAGPVVGGAAIFLRKRLFLACIEPSRNVTFFGAAKKVTPPGGDALSLPKWLG